MATPPPSSVDSISTPTSAASPAEAQASLTSVALRVGDTPPGVTFRLIPGGDQVAGQVTLDLCGAVFPSEQHRTSRLQQAAIDSSMNVIVNNENVRYASAADAAEALTELRGAITNCDPSRFWSSHSSGVPPLRYNLSPVPEDLLARLSPDHVAFIGVVTAHNGSTASQALIYQRRGAILSALYGRTIDGLLPYADIVAARLDALTASEAGDS